MLIEVIKKRIIEDAVNPTIEIKCLVKNIFKNEFLLSVKGLLRSGDKKLISILEAVPEKPLNYCRITPERFNNDSQEQTVLFYGVISSKAASYIEFLRDDDRKGDVQLELNWTCEYISVNLTEQKVVHLKDTEGRQFICIPNSSDYSPGEKLLISRDYIAEKNHSEGFLNLTIPASDWLHDFKPLLGLGTYIGIEVPLPKQVESEDHCDASQRVYNHYSSIKGFYIECRWGDVVIETRKLLEYLKADSVFKKLCSSERYNEETFDEFRKILDSGFQFAAKFQHTTDRRKQPIDDPEVASRLDAEFCLGLASGVTALALRLIELQVANTHNEQ